MINDFDIVIIGAGISGSTIAERYANTRGKKVLIIDKRNHIGGNCYDYFDKYGILVPKYGPHFFHTNDDEVFKYINKFGQWIKYHHKVRAYVDNKLIPLPININSINILFNLNIKSEKEMNNWLLKNQIKIQNPKNSEEVALSRVGKEIYQKIFLLYTLKQWEKHPKELSPEVIGRIPIYNSFYDGYFTDKYQLMPKNGYYKIFEKMLSHRKIKYLLNTDFFQIKKEINYSKQKIFFTGPIDHYFQYVYGDKLEYRSLKFRYVNKNKVFFQKTAQINYPSLKYKFTRITEPKHATFQKSKSTTIIYEYPSSQGEPYYPIPNDRNKKIYEKYKSLAKKEEKKNVYFLGRLANYKYFNMDQAFKNALDFFYNIEKIKRKI